MSVSKCRATTVTPGRTPPSESRMTPAISPVLVCAPAGAANPRTVAVKSNPQSDLRNQAKSACFVDADFGFLAATMWNGKVETGLLRNEQRRTGSTGGCDKRDLSETVGILFLKNNEGNLAPTDLQSFSGRIVEQIAGGSADV